MGYNEPLPSSGSLVSGNLAAVPEADFVAGPGLPRFAGLEEMVRTPRAAQPVQCMHPEKPAQAARMFLEQFPGPAPAKCRGSRHLKLVKSGSGQ